MFDVSATGKQRNLTYQHLNCLFYLLLIQDGMVDQVPDIQRSWIRKLCSFTVPKPTERLIAINADACLVYVIFNGK